MKVVKDYSRHWYVIPNGMFTNNKEMHTKLYVYTYKNITEKNILIKHCNLFKDFDSNNDIFYIINTRRLKILILNKDEDTIILNDIIKNSNELIL